MTKITPQTHFHILFHSQRVTNFRWAVSLSTFAQWKQAAEC